MVTVTLWVFTCKRTNAYRFRTVDTIRGVLVKGKPSEPKKCLKYLQLRLVTRYFPIFIVAISSPLSPVSMRLEFGTVVRYRVKNTWVCIFMHIDIPENFNGELKKKAWRQNYMQAKGQFINSDMTKHFIYSFIAE